MAAAQRKTEASILDGGAGKLIDRCAEAVAAADRVLGLAKTGAKAKIAEAGGMDAAQHVAHGLAWLATTVESLRQMQLWAGRLKDEGKFGEFEQLLLAAAIAEYGAQIAGGIPMSQLELIRPEALGVSRAEIRRFEDAVADLVSEGGAQVYKDPEGNVETILEPPGGEPRVTVQPPQSPSMNLGPPLQLNNPPFHVLPAVVPTKPPAPDFPQKAR